MPYSIIFGFVLLSLILFVIVKMQWINNETLQIVTNIANILAMLIAASMLIISLPRNNSESPTPITSSPLITTTKQAKLITTTTSTNPTSFYDDFNDLAHDRLFNQELWLYRNNQTNQIYQQDGVLVVTRAQRLDNNQGLTANPYNYVSLQSLTTNKTIFIEAKLMLSSERTEGNVHLQLQADLPENESWFSQCTINNYSSGWAVCNNMHWPSDAATTYSSQGKRVEYDSWHLFRMELNPSNMEFTYYIDDQIMGSYIPIKYEEIKMAEFRLLIGVSGTNVTGYIDDVRLGQIQ